MSLASAVERQFARPFVQEDWVLFKGMADANLSEAAHLKRKDMRRSAISSLLARNVRKRLLIGLGTELLLKAAFLKAGYAINLRPGKGPFPVKFSDLGNAKLRPKTASLDDCIEHLTKVMPDPSAQDAREGLKIARVFRNKEAHSVLEAHVFDATTYRTVEAALKVVYRDAFEEHLRVTISMAKNERAEWKIKGAAR